MHPIDLVLPYVHSRAGDVELRFALRSIERYAAGVGEIVVVGDDPGFLHYPARHLDCPIFTTVPKDARIALQILWAFDRCPRMEFGILWNDDYILVQETDVRRIPAYHKGITLREAAERHKSARYRSTLFATALELESDEYPSWHYDLHAPICFNSRCFRMMWDRWAASARSPTGFVVKSLYANLWRCDKKDPTMEDLKFNKFPGREEFERLTADRWIYSYGNITLRTGLLNYLNEIYPEKSRYER